VGHLVADLVCMPIVLKVGMVSEDEDSVSGSEKEVTPVF
jgi:hypothetical protein